MQDSSDNFGSNMNESDSRENHRDHMPKEKQPKVDTNKRSSGGHKKAPVESDHVQPSQADKRQKGAPAVKSQALSGDDHIRQGELLITQTKEFTMYSSLTMRLMMDSVSDFDGR